MPMRRYCNRFRLHNSGYLKWVRVVNPRLYWVHNYNMTAILACNRKVLPLMAGRVK